MHKSSDEPVPVCAYCCPHDLAYAVHKQPHDGTYVRCTCEEGFGGARHKRPFSEHQIVPDSGRVQ
jgi:hypothetical protein